MRMTVSDLIDYLNQFDPKTPVYLYGAEMPDDGDGIALDCIEYETE
jgi:hypothetical protein